jgi:hypothetical protein
MLDYSAYRPICLLNTLGKLLEVVMARRLAYYAETHKLLLDTHNSEAVSKEPQNRHFLSSQMPSTKPNEKTRLLL